MPASTETQPKTEVSWIEKYKIAIHAVVSVFCALIYIIPILSSKAPVLDELYIFDTRDEEDPNLVNNRDVLGISSLSELFQNDYWGKNLFAMDSHRSWRPLCVLTFRIFNSLSASKVGIFRGLEEILPVSTMFVHRCVNLNHLPEPFIFSSNLTKTSSQFY